MCGLCGFSNYSNKPIKDLSALTNALAIQSAARGTDATGIAFCRSGYIHIIKDAKDASKMEFKHPDDIKALIGHTRHSTQGSEKQNRNNHPFLGKTKNIKFALAHNGVLFNDDTLRETFHLPKTRIETDSYIAVQLLEHKRQLNAESLKFMAEQVDGSFSFSILDNSDNLYLVKGDSPLSIIHFPRVKLYVYASTDEILYKALINTTLLSELKAKEYEEIDLKEGDILKILPNGKTEKSKFDYNKSYGRGWWEYGMPYHYPISHTDEKNARELYIEELKYAAMYEGIEPGQIDELLEAGMTIEEVEEYVYAYEGYY